MPCVSYTNRAKVMRRDGLDLDCMQTPRACQHGQPQTSPEEIGNDALRRGSRIVVSLPGNFLNDGMIRGGNLQITRECSVFGAVSVFACGAVYIM
ncbi:hypothetical protein BaRGS_00031337 [Batillaria attramentaria]|uniref:Uncharacterized protein n=1 Tax=Batillaria attramentaria TaxID=370345 RepID=A0ABD0JRY9_9CAEN